MKLIPLTQGQFAQVDDDMYLFLIHWKWYAAKRRGTFYAQRCVNMNNKKVRITIHMARFIIGETDPNIEIDHHDHDTLNNQGYNLRRANFQQQKMNTRSVKGSTSKYKGVHWDKKKKRWKVQICLNYKVRYIGRFRKEEDAARAYDKKAIELFGKWAALNFPEEHKDIAA